MFHFLKYLPWAPQNSLSLETAALMSSKILKCGVLNKRSLSTKALLFNDLITEHMLDMTVMWNTAET